MEPDTPAPSWVVPRVPTPPKASTRAGPSPFLVKIWITPPTASAPYMAEAGPRRISMRSICDRGMLSSDGWPLVTEPTRTPSISRIVWLPLAPRR